MGLTIVERLRGLHDFVPGKDFQDAMADGADEIERLEDEVAALRVAAQMAVQAHEDGEDMQWPIDRLTTLLDAALAAKERT